MRKVSVYVKGDRNSTAYYRIYQYFDKIKDTEFIYRVMYPKYVQRHYMPIGCQNVVIKFCIYLISLSRSLGFMVDDLFNRPKVIVVHKRVISRYTPYIFFGIISLLKRTCKTKIVWDFDDDLVLGKEMTLNNFKHMARIADRIVVTHDYLRSKIEERYQDKVVILPTTDGDMYDPNEKEAVLRNRLNSLHEKIIIVWVATSSNIKNLLPVLPMLDVAAKRIKALDGRQMILNIVCDKPVQYECKYLRLDNIRWTREIAQNKIESAHIGIMPLINNEYNRGKGGGKLVQYLSTGLPCVASDVGYNSRVINEKCGFLVRNEKEWITAVCDIANAGKWTLFSDAALERYTRYFSYENNLKAWKNILHQFE